MPGLGIIIPRDGSGPIVEDDALLTSGSLVLIDPIHTLNPWAGGVPAHDADIPNVASAKVATLLGGADGTQYPAKIKIGGDINNGTKGLLERTTKGALHGIVSQANALTSDDGVAIGINADIKTYLIANTAHRFYMSQWDRITRINAGTLSSTQAAEFGVMGPGTSTSMVAVVRPSTSLVGNNTAVTNIVAEPDLNVAGERFVAVGTHVDSTANSSTVHSGPFWGAYTGTYNAAVLASRNTYWPSFVFRRFYLEDLTVSGRTFAEVAAIDEAAWTAAVASGGRYGSDTFTAASSVA